MKILLLGLTLALTFTLGTSGVLVTAANAASPGNLLYPLDRSLEDLRLEMTSDPQAAAQLKAYYAIERLREVEDLLDRGKFEYLEQAISDAGLVLSEIESTSTTQIGYSASEVARLINTALQVQQEPPENENGDEDGDADNANENTNEDENLNGEEGEQDSFKQPKNGIHCSGEEGAAHPVGEKLAAEFEVEYAEVMEWFCQGYGFGEVKLGYMLSQQADVPVEEVFDLRGGGMGWGNVLQQYGLIGKNANSLKKSNKDRPEKNPVFNPAPTPTPNPLLLSGKSKGQGASKSNNGNGKPKGKP